MVTAQIKLTEQDDLALRVIAEQTGRTEDELVREAVRQYIEQFRRSHRQALFQQARGMWRNRQDLPAASSLRDEFERRELG